MPWTHVISDLRGELQKNCKKKKNQKEFRVDKVIKKKGDKLYVRWKGYDK